jgi:hypothetical protein
MPARDVEALDRHVLVMAVWLPFAFAAAALFHYGLGAGGWPFLAAGFAALIAAFAGHVIVNVALGTLFTPREVALGLLLYGVGLAVFGFAVLLSPGFRDANALPLSLGFISTAVAVVFTMVTWLGIRDAFKSFDVIRRFRQR